MIIFSFIVLVLFFPTILFINANDILLNTYFSKKCSKNLCIPKVIGFTHRESNEEFLKSERSKEFNRQIEENLETDMSKLYFKKHFIYSVLDGSVAKDIFSMFQSKKLENLSDIEKFKSVYTIHNYKRFEQLFVYIGSGIYKRHHEHVFKTKSMCPTKDQTFANSRTLSVQNYMCLSLYDTSKQSSDKNSDIFVYQIMGVKNLKQSLKIETALIYILHGIVVNKRVSASIDIKTVHFLAHYVIEYVFRFMKDQYKNIKFDHQITPEFPVHKIQTFGMYDNNDSPNKLIFQGKAHYRYDTRSYNLNKKTTVNGITPFVYLPLGILDYELPDKESLKSARLEFDKQMITFFKFNDPNVYDCYNQEKRNMKQINFLKDLIGELYTITSACIKYPLITESQTQTSKNQVALNEGFFRRVRANFEHIILHTLFMQNEKVQHLLYVEWDDNSEIKKIQNQKLPDHFNFRCREFENFVLVEELDEKVKDFKMNNIMAENNDEVFEEFDNVQNDQENFKDFLKFDDQESDNCDAYDGCDDEEIINLSDTIILSSEDDTYDNNLDSQESGNEEPMDVI